MKLAIRGVIFKQDLLHPSYDSDHGSRTSDHAFRDPKPIQQGRMVHTRENSEARVLLLKNAAITMEYNPG